MAARHLSSEIVSLIHHVELNESGWWKKAIGQVIKGVLWKAQSPQTVNEIKAGLRHELSVDLSEDVVQRQLDILSSQGIVSRLPGANYKLTEQARQTLSGEYARATTEQEECQRSFLEACQEHCPDLVGQDVWNAFTRALLNAVQIAGANLFHLLADGNLEKEVDWLSSFISKFGVTHTAGLRKVLAAFFSPNNQPCRAQVLRLLTAHFFAEAAQLRPETISLIEHARKQRTIKVVLDTNFIFSVLQLHDNPADDAALSLLDIVERNSNQLEIKLYVLPGTLDEAQATLANQMRMVQQIRTTNAMARAALTQPLPSIARKFFDAAQRSTGLTAESFFQPYISDLRTILREKGIHVLEAHPAIYNQRQDVIDDVLEEQRREVQEIPEPRRKGYETLLHDVVLWHAVRDRRSEDTDTPFEVEYWAVSIDWRLMAFDRKKRSDNASKLPVVIHPSNLVQLIQFWIPRTKALEESLFDSLRLSLYFQQFDPEDERATVKVLEALSRFENVTDLPEATLKLVLANQALRGRLREADASNDEIFELVREELLVEHSRTVQALGNTQNVLAHTEASLDERNRLLDEANQRLLDAENERNRERERAIEAERKAEVAEAERIRHEAMARTAQDQQRAEADRIQKQKFVLFVFLIPIFTGIALGFGVHSFAFNYFPDEKQLWAARATVAAASLLPMAVALALASFYVPKHPTLASWLPAKAAAQVGGKGVMAPLLIGAGAIYQGGVWDGVKVAFGLN
jgi:hypothetical protein